ncbi:pantoate--beta-alanine ligase [Marinobacter segnicrescens]|uniref:Pantothenate synthetase n=1 Tax=Marinobacter segnicrescens TaxID=430453 RepID=A0A1I0H641_9GAMM|nr:MULTISPECIES: pantoate--beta-alanine ligase [Marinobacter]UZD65134.1 pantoate--beta-alanine ligase [Marinobacter sp. AN1]SET79023.1 pantoate--beta-alanine ligase [Marinobacter segnicrescens]
MRTVHTLKELRAIIRSYRTQGKRVGLVPTMGNLHEGHLALVRRAHEAADVVVTSIFVNPMQFGAGEDLDAYPRTLADDQRKLEAEGNTLLFAPPISEVYPDGLARQTRVIVPEVSEGHCGASRPGHFEGVATVVSMLFNMVQPDVAVFGEKDYQQLAVIRKMVRDLFIPVDVIGLPTIRDEDGLAMSSRNGYLSAAERKKAPALHRLLSETGAALLGGSDDYAGLETAAREALTAEGFRPDYFNIVNSLTLKPASPGDRQLTLLAAAFLGTTRLIDNLSIER